MRVKHGHPDPDHPSVTPQLLDALHRAANAEELMMACEAEVTIWLERHLKSCPACRRYAKQHPAIPYQPRYAEWRSHIS